MDTLADLASRSTKEVRVLPNGDRIEIHALVIHFPPSPLGKLSPGSTYYRNPGRRIPGSYLSKPLVEVRGAPLFGELAIARCLEMDGWSAVWVDSYHGRGKRLCWRDLPDRSDPYSFDDAPTAAEKYEQITRENGGVGGWFDVLAWRGGQFLFVEYKAARDRPNANEVRWIDSALRSGVTPSEMHFVLY